MNRVASLVVLTAFIATTALHHAPAGADELKLGPPTKIQGGFAFTEGPASDSDGNVYFTDIPNEKIHVIRTDGTLETFMEDSRKCNGLMFDGGGDLWACQGDEGRIIRIDMKDKSIHAVADKIDGGPFLSTNDLALDGHGGAYFTDPAYWRHPDSKVAEAAYYVDSSGAVTRIIDGLPRPNGILLSPDGSTLYLMPAGRKVLLASKVIEPGKLGPFETLAELPAGGDGLTCDTEGNLYLTQPRNRNILVLSKDGEKLTSIRIPESPANVAFGGPEMDTLYVTARTSIYAVPTNRKGLRPGENSEPAGDAVPKEE